MAVGQTEVAQNLPLSNAVSPEPERRTALIHPIIDFLGFGGGTLVAIPLIALFMPTSEAALAMVALIGFWLAHVINHPHFAHSYQIFYKGFRNKAFGTETALAMRIRYIFAGILVPLALVIFFVVSIGLGDAVLLGYGANLMFFLVGWHYAKQGYGMLMVDAGLKRQFFDAGEKKILLLNAHIGWVVIWLAINATLAESKHWGIEFFSIPVHSKIVGAGFAMFAFTTALTLLMFARKWLREGRLLVNGITGYVVSLYIWLLAARIDPHLIFLVPMQHSLQYLTVVWRYQLNVETDRKRKIFSSWSRWHSFILFSLLGVALGYLGFRLAPAVLNAYVPYDKTVFGGALFFFVFSIFINVHHYFLDNVMWRRENPETRKYLFG